MNTYKIIKVFGQELYLSGLNQFSKNYKEAMIFDKTCVSPEHYILTGRAGQEILEIITLYQKQVQ